MTKEEFVERYRHEFGGMIADIGTTDNRGAALALRLRGNFRRIDELLAQIYRELSVPDPKTATQPNGVAPTRKV